MFNDTTKLIEATRQNLIATERGVREAKETRDELTRQLNNARRRLERKRTSESYPNKLVQQILKDLKTGNELKITLIQAIDQAIVESGSVEWGHDVYKSALYRVADEVDIYKLITVGSGWTTRLAPKIDFAQKAGTLADYGRGITAYRQTVLKTKTGGDGSNRGLKATNWWSTRVFGTSLMTKTLQGRLELSGREAPFWQLLNSGSVGMVSDRPDGSFNPFPSAPTDFIGDAERSIQRLFNVRFLPEMAAWADETIKFGEEVQQLKVYRDEFSSEVEQLKVDARQNQRIMASFGKKKVYADENKIALAAKKYRAGEEFERVLVSKVGAKSRVYLTSKIMEGLMEY